MGSLAILTMADAVRWACELIPGASAVVEEHIAGLSEFGPAPEPSSGVAPYSFFTDLREFVFADGSDPARIAGLFRFVEATLDSPDQDVRDGSLIRIAHKLSRYEAQIAQSGIAPGPRLRRAMA
jgi:hypothetical protein